MTASISRNKSKDQIMPLPHDVARCDGGNCPSKRNCKRYLERKSKGDYVVNAALWIRREAGASACDMVIFDNVVSTFAEPQ